jgi:hypothetical protein
MIAGRNRITVMLGIRVRGVWIRIRILNRTRIKSEGVFIFIFLRFRLFKSRFMVVEGDG